MAEDGKVEMIRDYVDVIEVYRDRGVAYLAWSSGIKDQHGHNTWDTNVECLLGEVEDVLGYTLPDGRQEPWIRIDHWRPATSW